MSDRRIGTKDRRIIDLAGRQVDRRKDHIRRAAIDQRTDEAYPKLKPDCLANLHLLKGRTLERAAYRAALRQFYREPDSV